MLSVIWTDEARDNLASIRAYIQQFSPLAAQRFSLRLVNAAERLAASPRVGRSTSRGHRELVVVRPYIIRYRITDEAVFIIRIRHGARRPS